MKEFILSEQATLFSHREVIGFGDTDFYVKKLNRDIANDLIVKNHYSKKFYNASYIHLGVYMNKELVGCLQFGYAMNPASQDSVVKGTAIDEYLELNRMWLDDRCPRNYETRAISYAIKYIKKVFPKVKWIQSFADERCKALGVVYQAASFGYFGEHTAIFWTLDDEIYHNSLMTRNPNLSKAAERIQLGKNRATSEKLRQFRYIHFIDKRQKKNCLLKEQSYPKRLTFNPL